MLHDKILETPIRTPFPNFALQTPLSHIQLKANQFADFECGVLYGTTISAAKVMASIEKFILEFQSAKMADGELVSEQIYRIKLNELDTFGGIFEIEGKHIRQFDRELYLQLIYYPAQMVSFFDSVIRSLYERYFIEPETDFQTRSHRQVRRGTILMGLRGLHEDQRICVKQLGPMNIDRLVMIRAIVIRVSDIYPEMKRAWFRCEHCGDQIGVELQNARVHQPEACRVCRRKDSIQIIHNLCTFTDKQYVKVQQLPELVAEGETPSALTAITYDTNVDGFRPGDRIELIGIFRAQSSKIDKHKGTIRTVFNTYLDVVSFSIVKQNRYDVEKISGFSDEERQQFHRFSEQPNVIQRLVQSFAPSIFGHQIVKKGILTQLFGGTKKTIPGRGQTRSDINICLVGDPSTAKSQLLQHVHRIAPRSIYTSGRGSSAVGLTANVRKDPQTKQFILESGALVLADQGICCIDEFDKMDENSRTILLEAMEQQTISIAKAGIVCQLNSRTAILAAANPIQSKYNTRQSIIANISLPPTLISRFDLIYILLDLADQATDTRLASHILDFYVNGRSSLPSQGPLSLHQLTRYITYAREYLQPMLTQAAGQKLKKQYKSLRAKGLSKKTISATPRQLESLIRMSEAFAKMRLSNEVTEEDVEQAIDLMLKATLQSATDPETGIVDLDIITTGRSAAMKQRLEVIAHQLRELLLNNQASYRKNKELQRVLIQFDSVQHRKKLGVTRSQLLQAMYKLQSESLLAIFGQNKNNPFIRLQVQTES